MNTAIENPDRVSLEEVARMREQLGAAVALRTAGIGLRPIDEVLIPEWARDIVRMIVAQFHATYPDGLPPAPECHPIVRSYQRRAEKLFDDEVAHQFVLEPPK